MTLTARAAAMLVLACLALGGLIGSAVTDYLNDKSRVVQVAAPEHRTAPNDVVLEKLPGTKPKQPAPTVPRGGTTTGTVEVTVTPPAIDLPERRVGDVVCPAERVECPPLDLRIDFGEKDGQQWAAVRSADGSEVTGRFLPAVTTAGIRDERITAVLDPMADRYTVAYTRDFGRWFAGGGLQIADGQADPVGVVGVSW
jgi:hypothetical protein